MRFVALSVGVAAIILLTGCGARTNSRVDSAPDASWITPYLAEELPSEGRSGLNVESVSRQQSDGGGFDVTVSGTFPASAEATGTNAWPLGRDGSRGPVWWVSLDPHGAFRTSFEFPSQVGDSDWAPYDVALIGGNPIFLDLENARWATEDGGPWSEMASD